MRHHGTVWDVDTVHSGLDFTVRHMVVSKVRGRFTKWNGTLHLDPERPAESSVSVRIDAASVDTGITDRDNHLRSADFFDVARFPEVTFESSRVEQRGPNSYRVTGNLTLHGVTREVTFDA